MDQAGHVVPAAEIQAQDVLPQIPGKLFHLKSERVRFDQRHALDGICGQAFQPGDHLKKIAPPKSFVGRFGFRDVNAQRMF